MDTIFPSALLLAMITIFVVDARRKRLEFLKKKAA